MTGERRASLCMAVAVLVLGAGRAVAGGMSCVLNLRLDYVANEVSAPNDSVRVRLTLGTGAVERGSRLDLHAVRFFLQCDTRVSKLLPCVQDGAVLAYGGDHTILTTCPGTWSTGHDATAAPNQVVFTPSESLAIPPDNPTFCELEFDVIVLGPSRDHTPGAVEQVAAVGFQRADAACDNGLRAVAAVTGGIPIAAGR